MKKYIVLCLFSALTFNFVKTSEEGGEDYESSQCVQLGKRMKPHLLKIREAAGEAKNYRVDSDQYYEILNRIELLRQKAHGYKDAQAILLNQNQERVASLSFPSSEIRILVMGLKPE